MAEIKLLGKNSILSLWDAAAATPAYLPIGCLTSNDISKTVEMQDGTVTKCETSPDPIYGKKSYQITWEAVAIETNLTHASVKKAGEIMDAAYEDKTPIFWKISTELSTGGPDVRYGKGFLTELSESAPVEGEITFSGTIVGSGDISATDLAV